MKLETWSIIIAGISVIISIIAIINTRKVEILKNELFRGKYKFTKLHEEQANKLKNIYLLIVELEREIYTYYQISKEQKGYSDKLEDVSGKVSNKINSLSKYLISNSIFFKHALVVDINNFLNLLKKVNGEIIEISIFPDSDKEKAELNKRLSIELPELKVKIELEFRKILGSE